MVNPPPPLLISIPPPHSVYLILPNFLTHPRLSRLLFPHPLPDPAFYLGPKSTDNILTILQRQYITTGLVTV